MIASCPSCGGALRSTVEAVRAAAFLHATAASLRIASTAPSERAPPVPAASATLGSVSDVSAEPLSPELSSGTSLQSIAPPRMTQLQPYRF